MKLSVLTILALLALIALTTAASDFENAVKCGKRFPVINTAIQSFCRNDNDPGWIESDVHYQVPRLHLGSLLYMRDARARTKKTFVCAITAY